MKQRLEALKERRESLARSVRIGASDLNIRINTRG
jgi:hypothetical protein